MFNKQENIGYKQFLFLIFFSSSVFSADIFFYEDIDDFTDETRITLEFIEDSHNDLNERKLYLQCEERGIVLAVENGIFFSMSDFLDVKIRFDKNQTSEYSFIHNDGFVGTLEKTIISQFVNEAKVSNDMVLKIEDNDHIMRFTNFRKDHNKIIQFLESSKSVPSCKLD